MAPELLLSKSPKYDQNVDVFAMGVCFFQLCYWVNPYDASKFKYVPEYEKYALSNEPESIKNKYLQQNIYSKEVNDIINRMLEKDPKKRIDSLSARNYAKQYFIEKYVKIHLLMLL